MYLASALKIRVGLRLKASTTKDTKAHEGKEFYEFAS